MNIIPQTEREKKLLIVLGIFLIFVLVFFIWNTIQGNLQNIQNQIQTEKEEQAKIVEMQKEYKELDVPIIQNRTLDNMENKIISLLENFDLKSNAGRITPTTSSVDNGKYSKKTIRLNIKEAPALEVMSFIREIEYSKNEPIIQIENFSSRKNIKLKKEKTYSFSITLVSFIKN